MVDEHELYRKLYGYLVEKAEESDFIYSEGEELRQYLRDKKDEAYDLINKEYNTEIDKRVFIKAFQSALEDAANFYIDELVEEIILDTIYDQIKYDDIHNKEEDLKVIYRILEKNYGITEDPSYVKELYEDMIESFESPKKKRGEKEKKNSNNIFKPGI